MDASEVGEQHVISYDVERDLTPLMLSNCQYQVERGGAALQHVDLDKLERQIVSRFLQGKPKLTLKVSPSRGLWDAHFPAASPTALLRHGHIPLSLAPSLRLAGFLSHGQCHASPSPPGHHQLCLLRVPAFWPAQPTRCFLLQPTPSAVCCTTLPEAVAGQRLQGPSCSPTALMAGAGPS